MPYEVANASEAPVEVLDLEELTEDELELIVGGAGIINLPDLY